jgi:hypothetical protein
MKKVRKLLLLSMALALAAVVGLGPAAAAPQEDAAALVAAAPPEGPAADVAAQGWSSCDDCSCACAPLADAWIAQLWTQDDAIIVAADATDGKDGKDGKDDKKVSQTIKTFKFIPTNDKCDRFVLNAQATTRPKRVIQAFPELTDLTEFVGVACQAGKKEVDFTAIAYGIKRAGKNDFKDDIVLIAVLSGTVELPKEADKGKDGVPHKCKCCEKNGCKDSKCSCTTGDYTAPNRHTPKHPGKCCCCVDGCKYDDCECKAGKYPDRKDGKDDKCFEPKELPAELTVAYYDANADKDGDGFPDKNQKPVICLSYNAKFRRVELLPQCKPTTKPTPVPANS